MYLESSKEFNDSENKTVQFKFISDDKLEFYAGFWYRKGFENIISISTQIGCRTQCKLFCNVEEFVRDITLQEMEFQISSIMNTLNISRHESIKISMVKEGEPLDNREIVKFVEKISKMNIPALKISTSMPYTCKDKLLEIFNKQYTNNMEIQLQISLSSTNDILRKKNVKIKLMNLSEIRNICDKLYDASIRNNNKYKYIVLSFTLYEESEFDSNIIASIFDPKKYCIRIRDASPSEKNAHVFTRLTNEKFNLYKQQIEGRGFYFVDGRSERLAVNNNLTMGLYKLREVLV